MRQRDHFVGFRGSEMPLAIPLPESEPVLKIAWLNSQRQMRGGETARIIGGTSRLPRPEFGDVRKVRRPILNLRIENWPEHRVLANIGVEMVKQLRQSIASTDAFVKSSRICC